MQKTYKQSGVIVILDKDDKTVVLDSGHLYTSITNNIEERQADLKGYFEHYEKTGTHSQYECSPEKKRAIEKHGGRLSVNCVFKTFTWNHAKRLASDLEQTEKALKQDQSLLVA